MNKSLFSFFQFCQSFFTSGIGIFACSNPFSIANFSAPSPTSITCCVVSITALATEIGCAIPSINATAPHLDFSSMMQASRVTCPSRSGLPPIPTLLLAKSASVTRTPCSTASTALPPLLSISHAARLASKPCTHVDKTIGPVANPSKEEANA